MSYNNDNRFGHFLRGGLTAAAVVTLANSIKNKNTIGGALSAAYLGNLVNRYIKGNDKVDLLPVLVGAYAGGKLSLPALTKPTLTNKTEHKSMEKQASRVKNLIKLKRLMLSKPHIYSKDKIKLILLKAFKNQYSTPSSITQKLSNITASLNNAVWGKHYRQAYKNYFDQLDKTRLSLVGNILYNLKKGKFDDQLLQVVRQQLDDPKVGIIHIPSELKKNLLSTGKESPLLLRIRHLLPYRQFQHRKILKPGRDIKSVLNRRRLKVKYNQPFSEVEDALNYLQETGERGLLSYYNNGKPIRFKSTEIDPVEKMLEDHYLTQRGKNNDLFTIRVPKKYARIKGQPVLPDLGYYFIDNTTGDLALIGLIGYRPAGGLKTYRAIFLESKPDKLVRLWGLDII